MKKDFFKNLKNKKGFTLAEVLLTLAIIGIIAAITLPTIIANYKDEEIKSLLNKNHSIIAQALRFYYMDYGILPCGHDFEARTFKEVFKTHFNILKDHGWSGYYNSSNHYEDYSNYNGTSYLYHYLFDDGQFVLNDGSFIMIENPQSSDNRVFITVDVNGYGKKPNRLGKDLFMFQVNNEGKLLPMGAEGTFYPADAYCSDTSDSDLNGAGCTVKVLTYKKHKK